MGTLAFHRVDASHMFRDLFPRLTDRFHLVAPDLPGFGQSDMPSRREFDYTFENIATVIERFTKVTGLGGFAIYVFDCPTCRSRRSRPRWRKAA